LLVDVLLRDGRAGWRKVDARLTAGDGHDCGAGAAAVPGLPESIRYDGRILHLAARGIDQRVIYSYSGSPPSGTEALGLQRYSAAAVVSHLPGAATDPVKGQVVVIGVSYPESRDLHETPVGQMPGALVLLNAIKSLHQFGQLHGPPSHYILLIEALLITLLAYLFSRFESWKVTMIFGFVVVLVLVPISFYVFHYGVWINLAAPLLGIQLHQAYVNWEEEQARTAQHRGEG